MNATKRLVLLVGVIFLCAGIMTAQQTTAKIFGVVQLEDGSLVPGVSVEATSPKLVGKTTAVTDENGVFRLVNLTPGVYKLVFSLQGFQTVVQENVMLKLEQTLNLKINMKLGSIEEAMTITGKVAQIDVKSTTKGMTLTKEVFNALPKGRNFDSLATTVPGASRENLLLGGVSIDGASGLENVYFVDGVDTTNIKNGRIGQDVSYDFADEIQIKSSGYNAEFGGSLGGVINIVTRSGGNEFHGEVLGYYSGAPLRTKNRDVLQLSRTDSTNRTAAYYSYDEWYGKDNEHTFEGGLNLGGYILKDKLWFFGTVMPVYFTNTRSVHHFDGNTRDWKRTQNNMNFQLKLTAQPLKNLRLGASVVNSSYKYKGNVTLASGSAISNSSSNPKVPYDNFGFSYPNMSGTFSADLTMGNNFMFSARAGFFKTNQNKQLVKPGEPCWQFRDENTYVPNTNIGLLDIPQSLQKSSGFQNYSFLDSKETKKSINQKLSAGFDISYFMNLAGEHSWKAGLAWGRRGQNVDDTANFPLMFFSWDKSFSKYGHDYGRGKYGYYAVRNNEITGTFGDFYDAFANTLAVYLQDSWTIANKFTLNFGVRAESESIPSYATGNPEFEKLVPIKFNLGDKISPRLGFVWDVNGDSSLKVFGSYGIFFDVMKLEMASGSFAGTKWKSTYYTLDTYDWDKIGVNNYFPGTNLVTFDYRAPSFNSVDADMKPMTQQEISLGLEKRLREDLSFSMRLVNKHLLWAIEDCGVVVPGLGEMYYITNPGGPFLQEKYRDAKAAGFIPANAPDATKAVRDYYAINLAVDKRFSNNWLGGISYTFSSLKGNYNGLASGDEVDNAGGRLNPNIARYFDNWYMSRDLNMKDANGPLPSDRPHYVKVYGSYTLPFGLTAGLVFNAMSGTPTSTEWMMDYQGYMPYGRADQKRSPTLVFADLYMEYNLKLGKNNLNINLNITNVTDTKTAQRIFPIYTQTVPQGLTDQRIADGPWKLEDYKGPKGDGAQLDPRYLKEYFFYGPLTARLGLKFSF